MLRTLRGIAPALGIEDSVIPCTDQRCERREELAARYGSGLEGNRQQAGT